MSMIWKSAILFARHRNYTLMDRFVMMGEELPLVMFSSLQVVLFLNYKPIGRILHKQSSWIWSTYIRLGIFAIHGREACWSLWWFTFGGAEVSKVCQCYNGALNAYLDKCLDIISCFNEFVIRHIPREENEKANILAQQASGYNVAKKYFSIRKLTRIKTESLVLDEPVRPVAETSLTTQTGLTAEGVKLTVWPLILIKRLRLRCRIGGCLSWSV